MTFLYSDNQWLAISGFVLHCYKRGCPTAKMVASSVNAVGVVASCLLSFGLGYVYNRSGESICTFLIKLCSWQQQQSTRAKDEFQSKPADNSKVVEDKDVRENKRKYKRQKLVSHCCHCFNYSASRSFAFEWILKWGVERLRLNVVMLLWPFTRKP